MEINLDYTLMLFIDSQIKAGNYKSTSAVIEAALKFYEKKEKKIEQLKVEIKKGLKSLDEGNYSTKTMEELTTESIAKVPKQEILSYKWKYGSPKKH